MIGRGFLIWMALGVIASGVLFHTSYRVQDLETRLAALDRDILEEQEAIQVLKAEWSYLNEPARLEQLATRYLILQPTGADQIGSLETIPAKLPVPHNAPPAVPRPGRKPVPHPASGVILANLGDVR